MQSLRKAISASSWCRLPAEVKQPLDGAEQLLCHQLSQFTKTPGTFFLEVFSPLFPLPILFSGSGQAGGAVCVLDSAMLGAAATSGHKPSIGKAVLGEYQPSSIFC